MTLRRSTSVALLAVLLVNAASAHHNMTAMFDLNDKVTLTGTFTKVDWRNPHINLTMDVKDASGKVETWQIEGPSPNFFRTRDVGKADFDAAVGKNRHGGSESSTRQVRLGADANRHIAGRQSGVRLSANC
jgi:hypothetical protein